MSRKIISIIMAGILLVGSIWLQSIEVKPERYQQHLQEKRVNTISMNETDKLVTHLPVIVIDDKKDDDVVVKIQYILGEEQTEYIAQIEQLVGTTEKKSYQIKTLQNSGNEEHYGIWILDGMQEDSTFMRNYIGYTLAGQMRLKSPEVEFCELIINGEYKGLYLLTEKLCDGKIPPEFIDESISFTEATPYMFELTMTKEKNDRQLNTFRDYTGRKGMVEGAEQTVEVVYPDATLTKNQIDYIERDISKFEKALASFDSADLEYGYPSFIDIGNFIDYYVLNEWMMNTQAMRDHTFIYKNIEDKFQIITNDFNHSFKVTEQGRSVVDNMIMSDIYWYHYLVKDEMFVAEIIERYRELREDVLNTDRVIELIDEVVKYLEPAIEREGMLGNSQIDYQEEVRKLKQIVVERTGYLDENIDTLKSQAHYSINKQFKHVEEK